MKRLPHFLLSGLLAVGLLTAAPAQAQPGAANRPAWGPAAPASARYYYLPEVGGYYDLRGQQYIVQREGRWQRLSQLNGFDRSNWRPRVLDDISDAPWNRHEEYRRRYPASLPPGQRKRLENGKGLPPGQAKKYYGNRDRDNRRYDDNDRRRDEERRRDGEIIPGVRLPRVILPGDQDRRDDDRRRNEDRNRDRRYDDNRRDDDDRDDRGKKDKGYKNKEYKGKGKDKD